MKVWEKAIELVVEVYKLTTDFPKEEKYGLISQMKRSALSIPSNIAEGAGRNHDKEFIHFLSIANGSSFELETQIIVASKLGLLSEENCKSLCERLSELQKMNFNLQKRLIEKSKT